MFDDDPMEMNEDLENLLNAICLDFSSGQNSSTSEEPIFPPLSLPLQPIPYQYSNQQQQQQPSLPLLSQWNPEKEEHPVKKRNQQDKENYWNI